MTTRKFPRLAALIAALFLAQAGRSQPDALMKLPGKTGYYFGKEGPPNMLNNDGLGDAVINNLRTQLMNITRLFEDCPDFRRPLGFDLRVQLSVTAAPASQYPANPASPSQNDGCRARWRDCARAHRSG